MKIAVKILENGRTYIDKDFLKKSRSEQEISMYCFSIVQIEDKYHDCDSSDFDGLIFNIKKYNKRKNYETNYQKIQTNLRRMEELSKDFIQDYLGATITNLDIKKQEFVRLHNEVRTLQGKEPRAYYLT